MTVAPCDRVLVDEHLATVRWVGCLPRGDGKTRWVGIEYDEAGRGKHNGLYEGVSYFECADGKGAFVKEHKVQRGRSLEAALIERYLVAGEDEELSIVGENNKSREVVFVGRKEAEERWAQIERLEEVYMMNESVSSIGDLSRVPGITMLRLDKNLLTSWEDVLRICEQLPRLQMLSLGWNVLKPLRAPLPGSFPLKSLSLNCTQVDWETIQNLSAAFPDLEELRLCNNNLGVMPAMDGFHALRLLALDNSEAADPAVANAVGWQALAAHFPKLEVLQLGGNRLEDVSELKSSPIKSLVLSDNLISDWATMGALSRACPALSDLRVARNPLFDEDQVPMPTARAVLTALFPTLVCLNGTVISAKDRVSAERYFLILAARADKAALALDPKKEIHARLTELHGNVVAATTDVNTAVLSSSLISLVLQPASAKHIGVAAKTKRVPTSMTLRDLKLLCNRLFKADVDTMRLVLVEPGQPTSMILKEESRELSFWGMANDCTIRIEDTKDDWPGDK